MNFLPTNYKRIRPVNPKWRYWQAIKSGEDFDDPNYHSQAEIHAACEEDLLTKQ